MAAKFLEGATQSLEGTLTRGTEGLSAKAVAVREKLEKAKENASAKFNDVKGALNKEPAPGGEKSTGFNPFAKKDETTVTTGGRRKTKRRRSKKRTGRKSKRRTGRKGKKRVRFSKRR